VNTPWWTQDCPVILTVMGKKTWLVEVKFLACAVAAPTVSYIYMVGSEIERIQNSTYFCG
jgi:hypothetical protein